MFLRLLGNIGLVVSLGVVSAPGALPLALGSPSVGSVPALANQSTRRIELSKLSTCTTYPCPAGYFWYWFEDPNCGPNHPDTFMAYIEYWNEDASFHHDAIAGHASYTCDQYYPSTVGSATIYQQCVNTSPWNCQDLGWTWGTHP